MADTEPGPGKAWTLSDWRDFLETAEAKTMDFDGFVSGQVKPEGVLFLLITSERMGTGMMLGKFKLYELSPWASDRWRELGGDNHWSWDELGPLLIQ